MTLMFVESMEGRQEGSRGSGKKCIGIDGGNGVETLRGLFDEIVLILLKESGVDEKDCAFPPLLIDGRGVDLLRLFEAVRVRGGCERVSKKGRWESIAVELGLGNANKRGLKLIYMKYLDELEKRVLKISDVKGSRVVKRINLKIVDPLNPKTLEVESKEFEVDDKLIGKQAGMSQFETDNSADGKRNDLDSMIMEFTRKLPLNLEISLNGGAESDFPNNDKKGSNSKSVAVNTSVGSRKRKRGSLQDMLYWVTKVAKHPMKSASEIFQKSHGYYAQSLLARQILFVKGPEGGKENSEVQSNINILPAYYDEATCFNNQPRGILRCSKRVSSKSFLEETDGIPDPEDFSCDSKLRVELDVESVLDPFKPVHSLVDSTDNIFTSPLDTNHSWIDNLPVEKHTSVGRKYQVDVPEWTGVVTESDSKWLGTQIWPLENEQNNALVSMIPAGRGRADSCSCKFPGSVACTRFHIAEKKLALKSELGPVFYLWRFDKMGEDYALSWSSKEESRFMQMVRRNPPSDGKCFWRCAPRYLRRKTSFMVVSYYFNVFVLRRRCYQNHMTPNEIDSDDDDNEFEILGDTIWDEAISIPDPKLLAYSDKQITELDKPEGLDTQALHRSSNGS